MKKHNNEQAAAPSPLNVEGQHTPKEWKVNEWLIFETGRNKAIFEGIVDFHLDDTEETKARLVLAASAPTLLKENEQLKVQVNALRDELGKWLHKMQEHQKEDSRIIAGYTLAANIEGATEMLIKSTIIFQSTALSQTETKVN